jgi:dipeptidyl aminopeptidase/acylaminoacyl peptidase
MLLSSSSEGVIYRVSASGGTPTAVTAVAKEAAEAHMYPTLLPDGRHFLYLVRRRPLEKSAIYLASLDSKEKRLIGPGESQALYAPPGYILLIRGGTLMAQRFDARALRAQGEAVPLAADVPYVGTSAYADFSVSTTGLLAFRRGERARTALTWFDRAGRALGTIGTPGSYSHLALSPDGSRLAVLREDAPRSNGIWLFDLQRNSSRAVVERGLYSSPIWSRDGRSILYGVGFRSEPGELRRRAWDGTGDEEVLFKTEGAVRPADVSPDGRALAYMTVTPQRDPDIMVLPLAGEAKAAGLVRTERTEGSPQFSPDGRWLAYTAFEGDRPETYVEPNPPKGGRFQVSVSGGTHPRWRADGKEIFYLSLDGTLMAAGVGPTSEGFRIDEPKALFRAPVDTTGFALATSPYVVAANGQRFLFASLLKSAAHPPVTVVLNWTAERRP